MSTSMPTSDGHQIRDLMTPVSASDDFAIIQAFSGG
jgi:hypothetical protein